MSALSRAIRSPLWVLAVLPGCFAPPIHYASQEVRIRHDAAADALDILILYDGIQTASQGGGENGIHVGHTFVHNVVAGHREFMLFDWPFHLDLDRIRDDLDSRTGDEKDPWTGHQREWLECLKDIRLVSSGLHAGVENRLSLHQRFRIEHAQRFLALVERALHIGVAASAGAGTLATDYPALDEPTRAAWAKLAKEQGSWLSLEGGGIEIVLPMTSTCATALLARIAEESARDPISAKMFGAVLSSLADLHISEDRVRLRFGPKDGAIRFRVEGEKDYDPSLSEDLHRPKDFPQKLPSSEDVIRSFTGS